MKTQSFDRVNAEPISPIMALALPSYDLPRLPATLTPKEFDRLGELESEFEGLQPSFERAAEILLEIRDKQLYRQHFRTFDAYCQRRWKMGARRGRQITDHARTVKNLQEAMEGTENGNRGSSHDWAKLPVPTNERQTRSISSLPADEQRQVWDEAVKDAGGKAPTGKQVQAAKEKLKPRIPPRGTDEHRFSQKETAETRSHAEELAETDPQVLKLAKKIFGIAMEAAGYKGKWEHRPDAQAGFIAIAKWHLGEIFSLARVVDEEAELRAKKLTTENAKNAESSKLEGYVIYREPMKGSVVKRTRYDTGGGWGNDPRKAKVYETLAEARERAFSHGDRVMTLAKAVRKFDYKLGR